MRFFHLPLLVCLILIGAQARADRPVLTLGCLLKPGYPDYEFLLPLLTSAFAQAGYDTRVVNLPTDTIVMQLRNGALDGDCGRVRNFSKSHDIDLVRVEPPLLFANMASLVRVENPQTNSTHNADIRAAYDTNVVALGTWLPKFDFKTLIPVAGVDEGLARLDQGLTDQYFGYHGDLERYFKQHPKYRAHYRYLGPSMVFPIHLFLHPKHRDLADKLGEILALQLRKKLSQLSPAETQALQAPKRDADKIFNMVCSTKIGSAEFTLAKKYYTTVFAMLGHQLHMTYETPPRALASLRAKRFDGVCGRRANFAEQWNLELERVNVPVIHLNLEAWSTDPFYNVNKPEDLKGLRVAHVRGQELFPMPLKHYQVAEEIEVIDIYNGLKMLAAGRFDVLIDKGLFFENALGQLHINNGLFKVGTFYDYDAFLFVQPEHRQLLKPLETLIQQEGFITPK